MEDVVKWPLWTSFGSEEHMTDAAVETFARLAVVSPQLYHGLGCEGVATFYSGAHETPHQCVCFSRKRLQQRDGCFASSRVVIQEAVGI